MSTSEPCEDGTAAGDEEGSRRRRRPRWLDLPLRRKGLVVVAFPLLALILTSGTFFLAAWENDKAHAAVVRTLMIDAETRTVLRLVVDAETGARGYLLTGAEPFLEPYRAARDALPTALARLDSLVLNQEQRQRLVALRPLIDQRLALSERLRQVGAAGAAAPEIGPLLEEGKALTDRIRAQMAAVQDTGSKLLGERRARAGRTTTLAYVTAVVGALLGLVGGIAATTLFTRGVTRRMAQLETAAGLLEDGLLVDAGPPGRDEIGRVSRALARASELLRRREAALAEARGFLERLLDAAPTAVIRLTLPELRTAYASSNIERLFGLTVEQALAPGLLPDRVHPDDVAAVRAAIRRIADGSAGHERLELRLRAGDGSDRWVSAVLLPEMGDDASRSGLLGYLTDVDERHRAQRALMEREQTLRAMFDATPDIVSVTESDGTLRAVNPAMERILGYDSAERVGRIGFDMIHPEDQPAARGAFERLLRGEADYVTLRYRARHADGRWVAVESQASPLTGSGDESTAFVAVTRDVTDQVRLEQAQHQAREAAEAANRSKSEFLSRMSHELRTPLNAVLGFAQLLELDELSAPHRDAVEHILKAGRHLLDLIDEVLDISRIEAGRLELSLEPLVVHEILAEVIDLVRPIAASAGVNLVDAGVSTESCEACALADRQRLKQVLLNLLSNAIKYNRRGGTVAVSCPPAPPGRVRIDVVDTGPGIRPEHLPLLFMPFERLGADGTDVEGTGIGLTLSRRLAEAMNGSLDVTSTVGQGSTFSVDLPAAEGPVERYERLNNRDAAPATPAEPRNTVLHIDDNVANLTLVERILAQRGGIDVVAAMQGRLGLELARQHRPVLILLDLHLPDMRGDEVLRRLLADPVTASIPVVMLSADATRGEVQRLLAAGAAAYLIKPLDVRELLRLIDEAVGSAG